MQDSAQFTCASQTYLINPIGCTVFNHFNGDTLFMDLCSIPCTFIVADGNGNVCMICGVDFSTGIKTSVNSIFQHYHSKHSQPK